MEISHKDTTQESLSTTLILSLSQTLILSLSPSPRQTLILHLSLTLTVRASLIHLVFLRMIHMIHLDSLRMTHKIHLDSLRMIHMIHLARVRMGLVTIVSTLTHSSVAASLRGQDKPKKLLRAWIRMLISHHPTIMFRQKK